MGAQEVHQPGCRGPQDLIGISSRTQLVVVIIDQKNNMIIDHSTQLVS